MPFWLTCLSWISLSLSFVCALVIVADILAGRRQQMWIMNVVWPVTALYSGLLGLLAYYRIGRLSRKEIAQDAEARGEEPPVKGKPFWQIAGIGSTHCGAGCSLGDMCAEGLLAAFPLTLFGYEIFGSWLVDFLFAYAFGIAFQYFTIVPMRHLSVGQGLWAAVKADTLSLTAWQVGMYGWMAVARFSIFGHQLDKTGPVFWFMMQIAMLGGFLTSYPVNWWLIRVGIKEKM